MQNLYYDGELHYEGEELTDNSKIKKCTQCKDCIYNSDGTIWSSRYDKACCYQYQYPTFKPSKIIHNKMKCKYYKKGV